MGRRVALLIALGLGLGACGSGTTNPVDDSEYDFAFADPPGDTVVACGRRILPKTETEAEERECLRLLSGRSHDVFTGVAVIGPDGRKASRVVTCRVTFKRLSHEEVEGYVASGDWRGKAGGYAVQGKASAFVTHISGSYTSIVGLPLHETVALLEGLGFPAARRWAAT